MTGRDGYRAENAAVTDAPPTSAAWVKNCGNARAMVAATRAWPSATK